MKEIDLRVTGGGNGSYGMLYFKNRLSIVFIGKKKIKRAEELIAVIRARVSDAGLIDDGFMAVLSVYLCEEREINIELLEQELRRINDKQKRES